LLGRFCGASTYAFVALRFFGAAAGAVPKGADADLKTWITFATGALDVTFDADGKAVAPAPGAVATRVGWILLRLFGLSLFSSLSEPFGGYPVSSLVSSTGTLTGKLLGAAAAHIDHMYVQLMIIYLFLSLLMDVGALLLLVQGFVPIDAFANPIFTSTSPRIFWGKRWNLQVTVSFKRCVFTPLFRGLRAPPTLAALITFISSGLFHEYQFLLSFPSYQFGRASLFFVAHGCISAVDALFAKTVGAHLAGVPWQLKAIGAPMMFSFTVPMFASIWREEGFFALISHLGVVVSP